VAFRGNGRSFSSEATAALVTALGASIAVFLLAGFTVDDAWIPARYAAHLASGAGYRFNESGPVTDGVTPLPFAPILALFSPHGDIVSTWKAARFLGACGWLVAAGLLGAKAFRSGRRWQRFAPLAVVLVSGPLAAWSVAGLETGLVLLLATLAVTAESALVGAAAAGLAAAFRPEMAVFAGIMGVARSFEREDGDRSLPVLLAIAPWALVYALRTALFGRGAPLSLLAKPADLRHGIDYVVAGLILGGAPIVAWAPIRLVADGGLLRSRWLVIAAFGHFAAVAMAGGDWMPLSRLLVPAFPALVVVACAVAERASSAATGLRTTLAVGAMGFALFRVGADARGVVAVRNHLIEQAIPVLAARGGVAALDVGWVSAATHGNVVDLAGLTDPAIAALPGGHTSKRVTAALLDVRGADTLVLLRRAGATEHDDDGGPYARSVEARLVEDEWIQTHFRKQTTLVSGPLEYVVFVRVVPTPRRATDSPPP
jgi:hypothetical protein